MNQSNQQEPQQDSTPRWEVKLDDFENAVLSPVVPGELQEWIQAVEAAFDELKKVYLEQIETTHDDQFREMTEQDEEMLPRIEELRNEDAEIAGLLQAFRLRLNHFMRIAEEDEGTGSNTSVAEDAERKRLEMLDEAGAIARRLRAQEMAITTWFSEAFARDRGPVD